MVLNLFLQLSGTKNRLARVAWICLVEAFGSRGGVQKISLIFCKDIALLLISLQFQFGIAL